MTTFALTIKANKEPICKAQMNSQEDAIEYFAKLKKLTREALLVVFNVIEVKK